MATVQAHLLAFTSALFCLCTVGAGLRQPAQFLATERKHSDIPFSSPKPSTVRADIEAALKNLSPAACPGQEDKLLSLIGDSITVLAPGIGPLTLYSPLEIIDFFSSSFLPCGVQFVLADVVVGNGALAPPLASSKPQSSSEAVDPVVTPTKASSLTDGKASFAVSRLVYADLATGAVGKALALWVLAGKRKVPKGVPPPNDDHYYWNLTVIGWNSDKPDNSLDLEALAGLVTPRGEAISQEASVISSEEQPQKMEEDKNAALESSKVNIWEALEESITYFQSNLTAGDISRASLFFSSSYPFYYLGDYKPAVVAITPVEKLRFTQSLVGGQYEYTNLQVWKLKIIDSEVGGTVGKATLQNAFSITKFQATFGEEVLTGHTLRLWEAETFLVSEKGSKLPGTKVVQYANRWVLFAPSEVPSPPPSPSPPLAHSPPVHPPKAPSPDAHSKNDVLSRIGVDSL